MFFLYSLSDSLTSQKLGMSKREESVISPRNLSLATGMIELPITELEETDKSRFGGANFKSYFGDDKSDVLGI